MADTERPNRSSNMAKAEGDRDNSPESRYEESGGTGITNRPLDEEVENQEDVPARGQSKPGAHAG
jgi:hypothetical protein